ncbi:MAG: sodium-dependent dicarboxylate transporter 2/3/5 [Thalassolituus oleivorans]|jgi:sodium-dependent dicarboxylate transporter 2/3/5
MGTPTDDQAENWGRRQRVGLYLGPALLLLFFVTPSPESLGAAGWHAAGIAVLMATWWISEAVPIAVTALLPLALFPISGVGSISDTASPYAAPIIFLFMGGFLVALAMQRWQLHKRIALRVISRVGTGPAAIVGGFMLASALLSMWVSNTATALMMLPGALSVIGLADESADSSVGANFSVALVLAIAYGCNIGGMATIVGTPPNALLVGFLESEYGQTISFAKWMAVGLPLVALGLPIAFLVLTRVTYPLKIKVIPGAAETVALELSNLGPMSREEKRVGVVFVLTALAWMTRPLLAPWIPGLSDAGIAMTGGLALFLIPSNLSKGEFLMDWPTARSLPWGTLILFGGGLSLAGAFTRTGLSSWIGESMAGMEGLPVLLILLVVVAVVVFLTELTSNVATTATFLPVIAAMALGIGQNPLLFAIPAVLAASCAFMLPVATPPNAIVFGTGRVTVPQMARAGLILNFVFLAIITVLGYTLMMWVFDVAPGVVPGWAR